VEQTSTMDDQKLTVTQSLPTQERVQQIFASLYKDNDFADVTLVTSDGWQVKGHRSVLGPNSPFFKNILLQTTGHPHPLVYLRDVPRDLLHLLLEFMYLGKVEVEHQLLSTFLSIGRDLQVEGLVEDVKLSKLDKQQVPSGAQGQQHPQQPYEHVAQRYNYAPQHPYQESYQRDQRLYNYTEATESFDTSGSHFNKNKQEKIIEDTSREAKSKTSVFSCDQCSFHTDNSTNLKTHFEEAHGRDNENFVCEMCNKVYISKNSLYQHRLNYHDDRQRDQIRYAKSKAVKKAKASERKRAKKENVQMAKDTYSCDLCGNKFARLPELFLHKKSEHGGGLHTCDHCDYQATQPANLERHKRMEHRAGSAISPAQSVIGPNELAGAGALSFGSPAQSFGSPAQRFGSPAQSPGVPAQSPGVPAKSPGVPAQNGENKVPRRSPEQREQSNGYKAKIVDEYSFKA